MHYLGIDVGSAYIKYALIDENENLLNLIAVKNIGNEINQINDKIDIILKEADIREENIKICSCGYGRKRVQNSDLIISEVTAVTKAVFNFNSNIDTIIDIGGQDFKVIKIDKKKGKVSNFFMNDKCSSGTGAFLNSLLDKLDIPFDKIDKLYFNTTDAVEFSSICTVFASSEAIGYLSKGHSIDSILRGGINLLVKKIEPFVLRFDDIQNYTITGGLNEVEAIRFGFKNTLPYQFIVINHGAYLAAIGCALAIKSLSSN